MKKILALTFPHSGQHLLIWLLEKYFSRNLDFPKHDNDKVSEARVFHVCQEGKFNHCVSYPCIDSRTTYQARHYRLPAPMKINHPYVNYLFQYRNPIYSALSLTGYGSYKDILLDYFYLKEMVRYIVWWKEWIHTWVLPSKGDNILKVVYEDLVSYPEITLKKVIKFIEPEEKINVEFLHKVIEKQEVSYKHNVKDYLYYEEHLDMLKAFENYLKKEIEILNIPKIWKK